MQVQEIKAASNGPQLFMAVLQFQCGGIHFKAAVTEELFINGDPTFAHQVLLNSAMGTYSFLISYGEDEQEGIEEAVKAMHTNSEGGLEELIAPTAVKRLPFLEAPIRLIREELLKMGRVE